MANNYVSRRSSNGLFPPRPIHGDNELERLLLCLEVPNCSCPFAAIQPCPWRQCGALTGGRCECPPLYPDPCHHVRAAARNWPPGLGMEDWLALLRAHDRVGMDGPPLPERPSPVLSDEARLALYEQRALEGRHYRHPCDLTGQALERLGLLARRDRTQEDVTIDGQRDDRRLPPGLSLHDLWERPEATVGDLLAAWRAARTKRGAA